MGAYHADMIEALIRLQKRPRDESDANEDLPTLDRQQAIDAVVACLSHEEPTAYGLTAADWAEHLMNELADNPAAVLLALLIGSTVPSVGAFLAGHLGNCIEGLANRQLAEMDPDEAEACL
ncbi:hypothetical protein KDH83_28640 [Achromobacter sp. Marseille-Q0513]|uniref:hypothetical protein n=1 Tax=Achromobacter sp. Marseille-Q0513 TaxID=2829161 RepID=UPI001B9AA99F|nr:hypothetical protein [Achromobacter sp. Marseille-Q0513]MBR8657291.1 hypothetical protein [Achromobacter sp. Marseille-Q0513]